MGKEVELQKEFYKYLLNAISALKIQVFIIPGGWNRANVVRNNYNLDYDIPKDEEYYHWQAIRSMDRNAEDIHNLMQETTTGLFRNKIKIQLADRLPKIMDNSRDIIIIKPFNILKNKDELPYSWAVTSDSISVWFSSLLSIPITILVKDIDFLMYKNERIDRVSHERLYRFMLNSGYTKDLKEHLGKGTEFPVDPYLPEIMMKNNASAFLMNGKKPEHLQMICSLIKKEEYESLTKYGTLIKKE